MENFSAEEIKQLLRKDEKYMIGVRLYAIYQIVNGAVSRDLEKIFIATSTQKLLLNIE